MGMRRHPRGDSARAGVTPTQAGAATSRRLSLILPMAEVGLAAISISDRAQFVREIFSSAISRRNRVPPEYIRAAGIDSSRMPKKASTET